MLYKPFTGMFRVSSVITIFMLALTCSISDSKNDNLIKAAMNGNLKATKLAIQKGANVNFRTRTR